MKGFPATIGNEPNRKCAVFYPWSGSSGADCSESEWFEFDCDKNDTPYSLIWTNSDEAQNIESTQHNVTQAQGSLMRSDSDTLYLFSAVWNYWYPDTWRILSPDSKFYLDEVFQFHVGSEFGHTLVFNFEHPDWPNVLAGKALSFKNAGFDGMYLDWWHSGAGNGRSEEDVDAARVAIAKAIREKVGYDFILLGNVGGLDDPTVQYLSGVTLEGWKPYSPRARKYLI